MTSVLLPCAVASGQDPRHHDPWFRSGQRALERARSLTPASPPAHNVVLFLGDGMDGTTITAARILAGQLRGETGEENLLAFERLPHVALLKTYNTNMQVPDSAGTMTAILSGVKTKAGVLGVSDAVVHGDAASVAAARVPTLVEEAAARGMAAGIVSTARITHATPAAAYAHAPDRDWEDDSELPQAARDLGFPDLARQLVDASGMLQVVLGGGRRHFLPREAADPEYPEARGARRDGNDLLAEWQARHPGGRFVWNASGLAVLDPAQVGRVLGLFEPSHMAYEADRADDPGGEPSLAEMTDFAIRRLAREPLGFVLVVEAGRIDHGHHAGNAYRALHDTIALADAVEVALERTRGTPTLVVVTADHGHTLTFAGYPRRGNPILGTVVPPERAGTPAGPMRDAGGKPYATLGYANGPGHLAPTTVQPAGPKHYPHFSRGPFETTGPAGERPELTNAQTTDPAYLQEAAVPLRTETHGGQDVTLFAGGPRAALFHGVQEQSYVYHAIRGALGWDDAAAPRKREANP